MRDWVGRDKWGWTGVIGLATDAVDPDRLYLAVGTYTNGWDPNNGAILRSRDRGATWRTAELPLKLGGNMPGRGMGERLAIDPHANSIVYLGVRGGYGLWRSIDYGALWSSVTNFPNPGNYADDPNDASGYSSDNQGILWITFDPRRGRRIVHVGVAGKENMLYRSTEAGRTWERVPGQPTGFIPHKGVIDDRGTLYLATSDTAGPYDGGRGEVWKLENDTWTRITPEPDSARGHSGLTLDRRKPGTLMVATQLSWWPDTVFFRSTDARATFTATAATGLPPTGNVRFKAVPGIAGEIWFAGGERDGVYGLWHSTNGGASFARHPDFVEADAVGFGAPARGRRYPSIFSSARMRGVRGIFRSDGRGRTWARINDDDHQYAWTGAAITGDPRVPGRVYAATNGRGIIYGEPA